MRLCHALRVLKACVRVRVPVYARCRVLRVLDAKGGDGVSGPREISLYEPFDARGKSFTLSEGRDRGGQVAERWQREILI